MEQVERFNVRDLIQTAVGSFAGALMFSLTQEVEVVGDSIGWLNVFLIFVVSLVAAFVIAYNLGVRRLKNKKIKLALHFIPVRISVHYLSALFFSALNLYILGINVASTPLVNAVKRIVVLALPATVFGSAVDLLDSQKE